MTTLLLTKEDVRGLIDMPSVIGAVEEAYRTFSGGEVDQPPYMGIHLSTPGAEIDFKAGYSRESEIVSLKASSGGFRDNPTRAQRHGNSAAVRRPERRADLCHGWQPADGFPDRRGRGCFGQGAARPDARRVGVLGTGNQARMQIRAIREVMQINQIHAWGRSPENVSTFAAEIEADYGIPVVAEETAQAAVAQADVVVTTTRASGVVLRAGWLRPGTHVVAIGTDQPGKQELDPELFRGARVVVDSAVQCSEKGELQHALAAGIVSGPDAEIGEVLLGGKPGRQSDEQITIFDSTGMAIQDNTTAAALLRLARERSIGTSFDFLAPAL